MNNHVYRSFKIYYDQNGKLKKPKAMITYFTKDIRSILKQRPKSSFSTIFKIALASKCIEKVSSIGLDKHNNSTIWIVRENLPNGTRSVVIYDHNQKIKSCNATTEIDGF